jgi:UPF0755 protein
VSAANADQSSAGIETGTYDVCKGISGAAAVKELLKKGNVEKNSQIDVQSHQWSTEVVDWFVQHRHWQKSDFDAAIKNNTIGLPAWSKIGNDWTVEGMLEPGLYPLTSKDNPQTVLTRMVKARMDKLAAIDFENKAKKLPCGGGTQCTPEQVLIIASMAESEVSTPTEASKISEAVLAHLKNTEALGIDSTAMYGLQKRIIGITHDLAADPKNPYSTYDPHKSLPPGPVSIPTIDTINAVLTPSQSAAYYWCGKNGSTVFFTQKQLKAAHTTNPCEVK